MNFPNHIEALIYASETPIALTEIRECLMTVFDSELQEGFLAEQIAIVRAKYASEDSVLELIEEAGGYRFVTKKDYYDTVKELIQLKDKRKLSTAAMETLAIIGYKQPITKNEIEQIRGVNSDYSVQKLLDKELISIIGRSDEPGRPILYGTSESFMTHFGLQSLKDLPQLKDFKQIDNSVGELVE